MYILGIESSCDDTAAAVIYVDEKNERGDKNIFELKSNIVSSQTEIHAKYGGVVPEAASRKHIESVSSVVDFAMKKSGISYDMLDAVAVTFAPGLIGSLLVGVCFAKSLAYSLGIPLIPVNHIEGHVGGALIENGIISEKFLALVVSGGHTSIYAVDDWTFEEIGYTRDDAAGEAFDKVGRVIGLPYPGGAEMDLLASGGFMRKDYLNISFPSPGIAGDNLEFSFSGLKTAAINYIRKRTSGMKAEDPSLLPDEVKEDIAAAFTKTVCDAVCQKVSKAADERNIRTVVLAGGVAANSHLRKELSETCEKAGIKLIVPRIPLCGDNGAMCAAAGYMLKRKNILADMYLNAFATDEKAAEYVKNTVLMRTSEK